MQTKIPERYLRQAKLIGKPRHLDDVRELAGLLSPEWPRMHMDLMDSGEPVADRQGFCTMQPFADPPTANQTQVAAAAITALWLPATTAPNTALPANTVRIGQVFKVTAWGITTTAVTGSQTLIVTPIFGSTATLAGNNPASLGASRTALVNAAVKTNVPWFLKMWVHFRAIGTAGLATCGGTFDAETVIGTAAGTNQATVTFGSGSATPTTVDTTANGGLIAAVTPSLNTQLFTALGVIMETRN